MKLNSLEEENTKMADDLESIKVEKSKQLKELRELYSK